jgi:methylated-DNA-[protein]-cysteine S-methyltransferase
MRGIAYYTSPVGELIIESEHDAITKVGFVKEEKVPAHPTAITDQCVSELDEYFFKGRKFFTVQLSLSGSTFQKKVWSELLTVPYGKTISYEQLSLQTGDIKAIRSVAAANGKNPVMIIVPCHRVIGKNGDLTGYAGGIEVKEWLLYHEGALLKQLSIF